MERWYNSPHQQMAMETSLYGELFILRQFQRNNPSRSVKALGDILVLHQSDILYILSMIHHLKHAHEMLITRANQEKLIVDDEVIDSVESTYRRTLSDIIAQEMVGIHILQCN